MNFKKLMVAASLLMLSGLANANIIGNLTYDASTNEISGDGYTYLGLDVLRDLTYSETLTATSAGGAYADYRIANQTEGNFFYNSLVGSTSGTSEWFSGAFGSDYYTSGADVAWFMSDTVDVGYVYLNSNSFVNNTWSTFANSDYYSKGRNAISWLLVKETNAVPEPGILALMGIGFLMIGFSVNRKKNQA